MRHFTCSSEPRKDLAVCRAKVNIGRASRIDLVAFRSAVMCVRSAGLRCALIRGKHALLEEKKPHFMLPNIINMAG